MYPDPCEGTGVELPNSMQMDVVAFGDFRKAHTSYEWVKCIKCELESGDVSKQARKFEMIDRVLHRVSKFRDPTQPGCDSLRAYRAAWELMTRIILSLYDRITPRRWLFARLLISHWKAKI
jgi:hypothetical protein